MMTNSNNMTTNNNKKIKWLEELPKELLEIIGKHLDSRIDVFRFRSVSTLWRSIAISYLQSQPTIPLDLPPPFNYTGILSHFTICRLENQTRTTTCLVKVFESSSGKLEHANPLVCHNISTKCSQVCKENNNNKSSVINLLDCRLVELTKGCSLKLKWKSSDSKTRVVLIGGKEVSFKNRLPVIKKTVLFNSDGVIVLFKSRGLWYWRFKGEEWVRLGSEGTYYDDVMVCNNEYYVINNWGIMYWIDDTTMNLVQYAPPLCGLGQLKNLVESEGQFYVVDFYFKENQVAADEDLIDCGRFRRVKIKVYKLDEEWGTWVDVKSLGDRVFVLGKDVCFSISVKDFAGCPGDCIYFLDTRLDDRNLRTKLKPLVIRVFQFENGSLRTMDCLPAYRKLFSPAKNWSLTTSSSP